MIKANGSVSCSNVLADSAVAEEIVGGFHKAFCVCLILVIFLMLAVSDVYKSVKTTRGHVWKRMDPKSRKGRQSTRYRRTAFFRSMPHCLNVSDLRVGLCGSFQL